MAIDGNYDGKITIKQGQGISQAIRDELGLSQAECNQLGGSIWTQILEQVSMQNEQGKIYDGGNDVKGATNKNFVVHSGQVIEFSRQIWNNIVQLVNDKLGKNIAKLESPIEGEDAASANIPTQDISNPKKDTNPPVKSSIKDSTPPSNIPSLNNANKTIEVEAKSIKYDNNGYESEYYDNQGNMIRSICRDDNNDIVFYNDYEYNDLGVVARQISYYSDGSFSHCIDNEYDAQGNLAREVHRNSDGTVDYYTDYEYDSKGNMIKEILRNADGTVSSYLEYEYNDQRVTLRKIYRNSDGSVNFYQDYEYDAQGNVIGEIKRNSDGTLKED